LISQRALQYFDQVTTPPKSLLSQDISVSVKRVQTPPNDPGDSFAPKRRGLLFSSGSQIMPNNNDEVHPRYLVLAELLRSEKAYIAALEVLDEVFITPLMQVAHGASAQSVKQGIQFARGNTQGQGAPVPGVAAGSQGGIMASLRQRRDAAESKTVANAIKQPDVTVLLQSVRQILTINKQLLRDLSSRLTTIDYSKCIGDIFCRFAVVLKVYNAYATNHPAVEKILTPRDVPLFARRTSLQNPEKSASSPSAPGSPSSTPGSPSASQGGDNDDAGEGPCESLINFVKILEDDERCDGRNFVQLLRMPKERLNRYKRILTSLLMHTPDEHNDAELLRSSLKLLDQSEKHISWSLRRRFNLEKLQDIQKSFSKVLPLGKQAPALVSARRWFKKEGYLVKRCRRDDRLVRFWLFNDALVYGVRAGVTKSAQSFRFCRFLMLKDMTVHDVEHGVDRRTNSDVNQELGDNRFAFEIRSPEKSFIVMVPHILYDKMSATNLLGNNSSSGNNLNLSGAGDKLNGGTPAPTFTPTTSGSSVNELASDEMKKRIKDDWLREILQCIHDIHEDEEAAPEEKRGAGETTDSLFKKTASHNKKIDEKAAPVWVHDQASNTCSQCPNKFTLTFRRHHCRSCGDLVCEACSKARVVLENIHPTKKQRVCKRCVAEMNEMAEEEV